MVAHAAETEIISDTMMPQHIATTRLSLCHRTRCPHISTPPLSRTSRTTHSLEVPVGDRHSTMNDGYGSSCRNDVWRICVVLPASPLLWSEECLRERITENLMQLITRYTMNGFLLRCQRGLSRRLCAGCDVDVELIGS